ncbi:uncharacterized protein isoform X2 [Rhodnius prolixus]|uniref:uncharacterized protein isoform X2 n=1 Tax=Rhodnius prolixus TaxID=13249 RepID=UPI003D18D75F
MILHFKIENTKKKKCYERVSIGKRLNYTDISVNVTLATVRLCEQECERIMCQAFSFGITNGGNGTCELASAKPKAETMMDFDYDLFYKNPKCLNKTSCFRRLATGRSLIDRYVRKTLLCDSLRSCEEACAQEVEFNCEGFNFRYDRSGYEQSKCQLTDVPSVKLSVTSDFNADRDFDFYEKDRDAPRNCFFPFLEFRPWTGYGRPGYGQPGYDHDHHGGEFHPNHIPHRKPPPPPPPPPPRGDGGFHHHHHYYQPDNRPSYYPSGHPHDDRLPGRPGIGGPGGGGSGGRPPGSAAPYPPPGSTAVGHYDHRQQEHGGNIGAGPPPPTWQWDYYPYRYGDRGGYEYGIGGGQPAYGLGSGWGLPDECFVRSRTGFRLDRPIVIVSTTVPSMYECEYRCVNERKFTCNVFSFRYSLSPTVPGDNCHLGERSYRSLDIYTDIIPDRDYDIYERNPNRKEGCQPKRYWGSDCFERVRSGLKLKTSVTKFAMKAHSLSECESACIYIPYFTCRAFSFRYGPPVIGDTNENCLLTDWPLPEMNINKHFVVDPECELYHRGSYGHGCEISRYPERGFSGHLPPPPVPSGGAPERHPPPPPPHPDTGGFRPTNEIHGSYIPPAKHPGGFLLPPNQPSGDYLPPPAKFPAGYLPPDKHHSAYPHAPPPPPPPPPPKEPHDTGGYHPRKPPVGYIPPEKPAIGYLPSNKPPPGYLPPEKPGGFYKPHGAIAAGALDVHHPPPDKPPHIGGYLPPPPPGKPLPSAVAPPLPPLEKPHPPGYLIPEKHHPHHYEGGYLPPPAKHDYHLGKRPGDYYASGGDYHQHHHLVGGGKPLEAGYLPPHSGHYSSGKYGVHGVYRSRPADHQCYIRYSTPARLLPPAIKTSLWVPTELECKESCTRAREKTRFRCATISYRDGQCELSDIEQRDLRPGYDYLQDKSFWMYTWDFGSAGCYRPPPPGQPPTISDHPPWGGRGVEATWSYFTVNGQPCRIGTACTLNPDVGVWTCPVDNGDWDYCCRSGHHCGYSDGFSYPWCYVGSADRDQWRPCSDTYYPYAHSGRKLHWPVAYLHKEGPPNVTITPTHMTFTNEYKPSIVESFLRSLVKEEQVNRESTMNNSNYSHNNSTPVFQQIDLLEPSKLVNESKNSTAMEKLWIWGQSKYNSTKDLQNTTSNEIMATPTNSTQISN